MSPIMENIHVLVEIVGGFYNTVVDKSIKIKLSRLTPCFVCVHHGGQHLSYINNNERRRKHKTRGLYVTTLYSLRTIKQIVTVKREESCLTARASKRKKLSTGKDFIRPIIPGQVPKAACRDWSYRHLLNQPSISQCTIPRAVKGARFVCQANPSQNHQKLTCAVPDHGVPKK